MPAVQFGEWLPDRGDIAAPGVRSVSNLVPTIDGYVYMPSERNSDFGALDSECIGAARGVTSSGTSYNVAGTETKLWLEQGSGYVDETVGAYTTSTSSNWTFAQYGNGIYAVNGSIPQEYVIGTSTDFADLSADASSAGSCMTFAEFLVLGNIVGRGVNNGIGTLEAGIHWSAIADPDLWEELGTDDALNVQSDYQVLEGDGGEITAMVPVGEYAIVFRERQVWRMDYVGPPAIFAFRKLDSRRGCVAKNAAIAVGGLVYFPSAQGWMVCNGASVQSIGHEKVDRTWRGLMDFSLTARVSVAHDPRLPAIFWTVPGTTTVFGYQYEIQRWFTLDINVEWLQTVVPSGGSLDSAPYATMDMDAASPAGLGDVDLDTLRPGVAESIGAFLSGIHELYIYDNTTALTGVIEPGDYELSERGLVRWIRPVLTGGSGTSISAQISARNNPLDSVVYQATQALNSVGVMPTRVAGRYLRGKFTTTGPVELLQGFDPQVQPMGTR